MNPGEGGDGGCTQFEIGEVRIAPHGTRRYRSREWEGVLVTVSVGTVELECDRGTVWRFPAGSVLILTGMPVRRLRNPGDVTLVLTTAGRIRLGRRP